MTATDSTNTSLSAKATTNVLNPAVATQLDLILPRQNVQVGVPVTVELAAVNAPGQPVQSFADTVTLASSDTAASLPTSISFVDGIATFSVTFNTAGSQTLTATDSTNTSLSAKATTNVVNPAVASQLVLILPRGNTQVGVPVTVQLAAVNSQGFAVQSFSDTVTLTSSDSAATLPSTITFVDGIATFSVTFNTAGTQTLTASDSTNTALMPKATTNVVNPAAATRLVLIVPRGARSWRCRHRRVGGRKLAGPSRAKLLGQGDSKQFGYGGHVA